jgi:invasion protein IalB
MLAATVLMADTTPAAAAAAATTATPAATPAAAPSKTEQPKLICKTEPVLGSLMPKKTCYTSEKMQNQVGLAVH